MSIYWIGELDTVTRYVTCCDMRDWLSYLTCSSTGRLFMASMLEFQSCHYWQDMSYRLMLWALVPFGVVLGTGYTPAQLILGLYATEKLTPFLLLWHFGLVYSSLDLDWWPEASLFLDRLVHSLWHRKGGGGTVPRQACAFTLSQHTFLHSARIIFYAYLIGLWLSHSMFCRVIFFTFVCKASLP